MADFMSSFKEGLSLVTDFLGGGLGSAASSALSESADMEQAMDNAVGIFDDSLGSCGTEGQMALVDQIGADGYKDALMQGIENGGDCSGTLGDKTDHPEAILDIIEQAEGELSDLAAAVLGKGTGDDEETEEEDDGGDIEVL